MIPGNSATLSARATRERPRFGPMKQASGPLKREVAKGAINLEEIP